MIRYAFMVENKNEEKYWLRKQLHHEIHLGWVHVEFYLEIDYLVNQI
jgi:hypothetical protein